MGLIGFVILIAIICILVQSHNQKESDATLDENKRSTTSSPSANLTSLEKQVLSSIGLSSWDDVPYIDESMPINDLRWPDEVCFLSERKSKLQDIEAVLIKKEQIGKILENFLESNIFETNPLYKRNIKPKVKKLLFNTKSYRVRLENTDQFGLPDDSILLITKDMIHYYPSQETEKAVLFALGLKGWGSIISIDFHELVNTRKAFESYDDIKFYQSNERNLGKAKKKIEKKKEQLFTLKRFLEYNQFKNEVGYDDIVKRINTLIDRAQNCRLQVKYITPAGNELGCKEIILTEERLNEIKNDPSLFLSKAELNRRLKEEEKEKLLQKQKKYYGYVNRIIDRANKAKDSMVIENGQEEMDSLIAQLFDRTVNSIKKVKTSNSEEWSVIETFIEHIDSQLKALIKRNQDILDYYRSEDFLRIKNTCQSLMDSQKEFNEYISEKVQSISHLFGVRVVRNETENNDENNYIRPYKKTITPFTAEVSATVFASAENNPMEYLVKKFYPNKKNYPHQIEQLCLLVEELQTLREAKQIIENYKVAYQQYLGDVPDSIMEYDSDGFYARLGFARIEERDINVEYKFVYTSNGGLAQRSFTIPMTEDTIADLIKILQSKLTATSFAKEQRNLMTKNLREHIKARDNYTCCNCGNSIHKEPNLLLEIDHIIPVSKGGKTEEKNLQTLCWKCNRAKGNKIID